uniref:hypothetical protein n=1 Tax=uncultured Parasutterella sp. TaxID=1263098 RepID=UPI0025E63ED9
TPRNQKKQIPYVLHFQRSEKLVEKIDRNSMWKKPNGQKKLERKDSNLILSRPNRQCPSAPTEKTT